MKTYVICYSDPNGVLQSQSVEIHVYSFHDAYVQSVKFQSRFIGLVLTSITLVL